MYKCENKSDLLMIIDSDIFVRILGIVISYVKR